MDAKSKNDGGPAFARPSSSTHSQVGMSLRDWFAGQALASMNSVPYTDTAKAINAYAIADAMLIAREKKE